MSLFSLLNVLLGGGYTQPTQPQQPQQPAVIPPAGGTGPAASQTTSAGPSQTDQSVTSTGATPPSSPPTTVIPTTASPADTATSTWPGQLPPPPDNGGVRFDFSDPMPEAADPLATGQTAAMMTTDGGTGSVRTEIETKPAFVTGNTMVRVQGDEDRLRAWAISMLQQERRAALPLSLITDATAAPPALAGAASSTVSPPAAANTDLTVAPAKLLVRA